MRCRNLAFYVLDVEERYLLGLVGLGVRRTVVLRDYFHDYDPPEMVGRITSLKE